jgi:hypothetical protein
MRISGTPGRATILHGNLRLEFRLSDFGRTRPHLGHARTSNHSEAPENNPAWIFLAPVEALERAVAAAA